MRLERSALGTERSNTYVQNADTGIRCPQLLGVYLPLPPCARISLRYRSAVRDDPDAAAGFPVEEAPIVANFFVIRFQDRCLHGRSEEKNLALEAQHAPQPPRAEGHDVSGMLELR